MSSSPWTRTSSYVYEMMYVILFINSERKVRIDWRSPVNYELMNNFLAGKVTLVTVSARISARRHFEFRLCGVFIKK